MIRLRHVQVACANMILVFNFLPSITKFFSQPEILTHYADSQYRVQWVALFVKCSQHVRVESVCVTIKCDRIANTSIDVSRFFGQNA